MHKHFLNEIVNYVKNINTEILNKYYHNPSFLTKDLHKANQATNEQIANLVYDALIDLRNAANQK